MLREIISGVVILVIALFIFSYIFDPMTRYQTNAFFSGISEKISSGIKGISQSVSGEKCSDFAKKLIPNYLMLYKEDIFVKYEPCTHPFDYWCNYKDYWSNGSWILTSDSSWNDGSKIVLFDAWEADVVHEIDSLYYSPFSVEYNEGSGTGQNINYYYLNPIQIGVKNGFGYSKKIIGSDGTVYGTRTFRMAPILKPIEGSETVEKIQESKTSFETKSTTMKTTMKFEIIDPNFVSCHWITDNGTVIE